MLHPDTKYFLFIVLFANFCLPIPSISQTNLHPPDHDTLKMQLKSMLDTADGGCLSFNISSVSPQHGDSLGHPSEYRSFVTIFNEGVVEFCRKGNYGIYKVLVELLKEDKYAWSANLLLFRLNGLDGNGLFRYKYNKCDLWKKEKMEYYINYWSKKYPSE
jgi:hypothetical protein